HVIDNADRITVTLLDERTVEAEVIGSDKDTDIAVLKVKADRLTDMSFADSDVIEVGDYVVAIGNPFGFGHSVTAGIISALGRSGINRDSYEDFIQTDAPINPGNSGGALINLRGELVGINSAIISNSGGSLGIGFAIPINMASSIMQQLLTHGEVKRGLLGVKILSVTPEIAAAWELKLDDGALIAEVTPGSAADQAGLQAGDVVTAINGQKVETAQELRNEIGLLRSGDSIRLGYIRDGKRATATAKLTNLQAASGDQNDEQDNEPLHRNLAGAEFADLPKNDSRYAGLNGILVVEVRAGSPAAQRDLRAGDVIVKVNRQPIKNLRDFRREIKDRDTIGLTVVRGGSQLLIFIG
ncbi:MAG: Do family serine endopeptidase, partial [Gammaproteobacteria bacterium]|nr:Do family serine endopeptidase [Gammaproteobacteria bacterium]